MGVYLGGDSAIMINWGSGKEGSHWRLAHIWHEISNLSKSLDVSFVHIPRVQNSLADYSVMQHKALIPILM